MKTIAETVVHAAKGCAAFSFYASYGQDYNGRTIRVPQGVKIQETRNNNGRCTRAEYEYADGSRVVFTWSPMNGSHFEAKAAKGVRA